MERKQNQTTPHFTVGHLGPQFVHHECGVCTVQWLELIGNVGIDFCWSGGCSFLVRWAASYRPATLSITRGDLHFKWCNGHFFVSSSCKLLRKLHFPSCCLLHSESRYIIMFPPCLAIQSGYNSSDVCLNRPGHLAVLSCLR